MRLLDALGIRKYFIIAFMSSALMFLLYIYSQTFGIIENIPFWFSIVPLYNIVLFFIFTIIFGITLSYQIYLKRQPKTCSIASSSATISVFLISQCPACASLGMFFLPLSAVGLLAKYNWAVNLFSIGMLMFTLNYLGAFRR